jgi:nucleotide-binding universal stress UspA family protein
MWLDQAGVDHRTAVESMRTAAQEMLAAARAIVVAEAPDLDVHEVVRVADPRDALLGLSEHASMIVLGSRGRGPVRSLLLGSVGVAVTRHAACPVVIHRPGSAGRVRHGVAVGVDGSDRMGTVLDFAYRQAALRDLPLTVVHCFWDVPTASTDTRLVDPRSAEVEEQRMVVAESVAGMAEKYPEVRVRTELARGLPDASLVQVAERMNLLVVGAHHGGAASAVLFGSVSTSVVEHATCPVAVVPVA